jgi:hypothetical protein
VILSAALVLSVALGDSQKCENFTSPKFDADSTIRAATNPPKSDLSVPPQFRERNASTSATPAPKTLGFDKLKAVFDDYPRRRGLIRVGDHIVADGVTMTLAAFDTTDEPIDVLAYYKQIFDKAGLYTVGAKELQSVSQFPGITAYDANTGLSRTIMVVPGEDNVHTVVLGLADAEEYFQYSRELRFLGLPPYPGVEQPVSVRSDDGALGSYTVIFSTPDAPERVVSFLRKEAPGVGLRAREMDESEAALHPDELDAKGVSLEGHGVRWAITARREPTGNTGVVAVARSAAAVAGGIVP